MAPFSRIFAGASRLPKASDLAKLIGRARAVLDSESPSLRPRDSRGRPGGLLQLPPLPTVIVPDIHARPSFVTAVLDWTPPARPGSPSGGGSLASLLAAGRANLVFLGDVFHSEAAGAQARWTAAFREYASGWRRRRAMDEEMGLSLAASRILLEAKIAYPANCHYLKGNHENIADEEGRGDHSFFKFVAEGEMVASWFRETYGAPLLASYRELELSLPLLALGDRFVASHGEPAFALTREELIEYRSRPEVVEALIWTGNDEAEEGSVEGSLEALVGGAEAEETLWFAGHRPVSGRYALRAGGKFVQFHNSAAARVVFLEPGRSPEPGRDILDIGN